MSILGEEYSQTELFGGELYTSSKPKTAMDIGGTQNNALNLIKLNDGTYIINPMLPSEEYDRQVNYFYKMVADEWGIPNVMIGGRLYLINPVRLGIFLVALTIVLGGVYLVLRKKIKGKKNGIQSLKTKKQNKRNI
jgi:hypothetical protein